MLTSGNGQAEEGRPGQALGTALGAAWAGSWLYSSVLLMCALVQVLAPVAAPCHPCETSRLCPQLPALAWPTLG